jgi:hypothetical protein
MRKKCTSYEYIQYKNNHNNMTLPRQSFGLNKFKTSVSQCPENPDAIKAIVVQSNNLAVVDGANTELELILSDFFMTIDYAEKRTINLPGTSGQVVPYSIYELTNPGNIKFMALLTDFSGTTSSTNQYIEWTTKKSIDEGNLYNLPTVGPSSSVGISLDINKINSLEFGWGSNISFLGGTGPLWLGTDGGILKWDGTDMTLWNTFNSEIQSDYVNSIVVDDNNNIWIGTNKGLSYFNEDTGFSSFKNYDNSDLLSDQINDLKLLSTNKIVIGTDEGMSIYNFEDDIWESFDIFSVPEMYYNQINQIEVNSTNIFLGTTGGVFMYDYVGLSWNSSPFNSTNTLGWTGPDNVTSLATYGSNLYVGTTGGLIILPFEGGTAQTIMSGATGPISSNIQSLRSVTYRTSHELYVGHDDGISIYNIDTDTWGFTANSINYSGLTGINDIIPDFLSGSTSGKTIFTGSDENFIKTFTTGPTFGSIPETNKSTNLLMVYPDNATELYPSEQPIYFMFSKSMNPASFQGKAILKYIGTTDCTQSLISGATVTGSWTWSNNNKVAKFTPASLVKASQYNLKVYPGSTASDSSYLKGNFNLNFYTENKESEEGWTPMGKLMILSGADSHYLSGLYLRNPQSFSVNVTVLLGLNE